MNDATTHAKDPLHPTIERARIMTEFGLRVRALRKKSGMTQQDLAEKSGMVRASIANAETGRLNLNLISASALASALGENPLDLLSSLAKCCGNFANCSSNCAARADHWRAQHDKVNSELIETQAHLARIAVRELSPPPAPVIDGPSIAQS